MLDGHKQLSKEERIAARRARILARKQQKDDSPSADTTPQDSDAQRLPKIQIAKSRAAIDALREQFDDEIADIVCRSDQRYANALYEWDNAQQRRGDLVHTMATDTGEWNDAIRSRWVVLAGIRVPQELYEKVVRQRGECERLVARKDEVIAALQADIKHKDVEYDEALQQQAGDVSMLIETMRRQFDETIAGHQQHLDDVEKAYAQERDELLTHNRRQMNDLFTKRRDMELRMMERKQQQEEMFQDELTMIRAKDADEYNNLKIVLENNIQLLEQQLEEMRATYQLNAEKLDYNHRVLKERDVENKQTVMHHKQKLKRLKESLSTAMARHAKLEDQYRQENQVLTDDFRRITVQFKEMQRKYRHFQLLDTQKYREVWEMNEEQVMDMVRQALRADQIIHEDILGRPWQAPPLPRHALANLHPAAAAAASTGGSGGGMMPQPPSSSASGRATRSPRASRASAHHQQQQQQSQQSHSNSHYSKDAAAAAEAGRFSNAQVRKVMLLLATEASFVVADQMRQIINGLPEEEQAMYLVDAILTALGVVDRDDLDDLVARFYNDDDMATEPTVSPHGVAAMLKEFTAARHGQQLDDGTGGVDDSSSPSSPSSASHHRDTNGAGGGGGDQKGAKKKHKQENGYWHALGHVIPPDDLKLWEVLEQRMWQYDEVLQERQAAIQETNELAKENEELRRTLQMYLSSPSNDDLQIPPNRLIRMSMNQ